MDNQQAHAMKAAKRDVRRMWGSDCLGEFCVYRTKGEARDSEGTVPLFLSRGADDTWGPVAVVSLDPDAVEAMVEKANQVLTRSFFGTIGVPKDECIREARAVLTAILGKLPTASRAKRG